MSKIYVLILTLAIFILGLYIGHEWEITEPESPLAMYDGLTLAHDDALALCEREGMIYDPEAQGITAFELCYTES